MGRFRSILAAPALAAALAATPACSPGSAEAPDATWAFAGEPLLGERDLSALALAGSVGVLASDETRQVQPLTVVGRTLVAGAPIELPDGGGKELDLEGAAASPRAFYVIGSHGATRGKGKLRRERYGLFELVRDEASGVYQPTRRTSLASLLERKLPEHAGRPLQHGGTNIEGLAFAAGRLYAGLRGPSVDGRAPILHFDLESVFEDADRAEATLVWVRLGPGVGIRGLCSVPGGFLLLAGDSAVREQEGDRYVNTLAAGRRARLAFWDGTSEATTPLVELDDAPGSPETVEWLGSDDGGRWRVLLLWDGVAGGSPRELAVAPPDRTGS